ncbi:MAG: hypothetical protein AB1423_00740 [Pseudomonadota bacterium]
MATKSFRFTTPGYPALEGVGALHASYTLLLNVTENDSKEGKVLFLSASMLCNAARDYGSGVIKPWCTVESNIDNKKYVLDARERCFALTQDEILIGGARFTLKTSKKHPASFKNRKRIRFKYRVYGLTAPAPNKATHYISLNKFRHF